MGPEGTNSQDQPTDSDEPILARIETRTGHGGGTPMQMVIEEVADVFAFLVHVLGTEA